MIDKIIGFARGGCCQTKSCTCLNDKFQAVRLGRKCNEQDRVALDFLGKL